MKNYIVLDLETPNKYANSMSSIGIILVEDGRVVDKIYSLINPEAQFDQFNIEFTGIHPEDVVDAPTFPEYYEEIKDMLLNNIIVGQNITFDLSVISKSLTRYGIPIPAFKYYCTLQSSKRNLNLPDNSLSYIVYNVLNRSYDAHNALADAEMTNVLYNYLDDYEDSRKKFVRDYCYRPNCKRDFDRNLDYNFNYLYGLIQKLKYQSYLSENYYRLLYNWYINNKSYNYHPLLQNAILKVAYILENYEYSEDTNKNTLDSFKEIKRSPQYKAPILKQQVLQGIIDSITCDQIRENDIMFLKKWIDHYKINDKTFKEFKKSLAYDDENLREYLQNYSEFLTKHIEKNKNLQY